LPQLEFLIHKRLPPAGGAAGFELGAASGFDLEVHLDCDSGVTVLFGPSGSGKTLTLDCLAGFVKPDQGRILLNDAILFDSGSGVSLPPRRRTVGYVFQSYALFPHMSVEQNLAFGIPHIAPLERRRRIHEMLELFGLAQHLKRRPSELSGGEKQRASIARALVTEPRLLLLDEPVRGLDYPLRADFYDILRNVRERYRIPILLVTHDVAEGFFLGDRMAVYGAGRIVQLGTPEDIFRRPRTPSIARLLGISNIYSGVIEELDPMAGRAVLKTPQFSLTVPYLPEKFRGDAVSFCIPRELVTLLAPGSAKGTNGRENFIPVRIASEVFAPATVRLQLAVAQNSASNASVAPGGSSVIESEVSRQTYQKMKLAQQREWLAELPSAAIHVFPDASEPRP
jgi:molybdate transport system ATP-binding protein